MIRVERYSSKYSFDLDVLCIKFVDHALDGVELTYEQRERFKEEFSNTTVIAINDDDKVVGAIVGADNIRCMDGARMLQEVFWYVEKDSPLIIRGLMTAFENMAKEEGYEFTTMTALANKHLNSVDKLYKRFGYEPLETHYIKPVGGED